MNPAIIIVDLYINNVYHVLEKEDLTDHRDFPRPDLISQFKNEKNLPKMVYIIPNFLVLHFGENFTKIRTKIAKIQMHENLYKNVNENMLLFTFLCTFS